ncbi:MAG: thiamine phosphate synthase [Lentimicrobiaceae bacterium]|nr:thiamine phosphate synthase [Lentimicrobiaceae bacterium]
MKMKLIAITKPDFYDGEAAFIKRLFESGFDIVHLRKPCCRDVARCVHNNDVARRVHIDCICNILNELSSEERSRIVVHDYPELYEEFSLKGIHINKNIVKYPEGYQGSKTRSCHSLEEVKLYKDDFDYVFLSPIFDSISKQGYKSAFTQDELRRASQEGIIDEKVVALGGVTYDKISLLKDLGFGGAAMMGGVFIN